eukprot:gene11469-15362_t
MIAYYRWKQTVFSLNKQFNLFLPQYDGVIFITDGGKGPAREASMLLSTLGFYVVIGCKSEAEKKSFLFEQKLGKGIEPIVFDIGDPTHVVKTMNRLIKIGKDYDRPIVGVLINSYDAILESTQLNSSIAVKQLDKNYKSLVKGPTSLIEALIEVILFQHSSIQQKNSNNLYGFRISSMIMDEEHEFFNNNQNGIQFSLQSSMKLLLDQTIREDVYSNISISLIHIKNNENQVNNHTSYSSSGTKNRKKMKRYKNRQQWSHEKLLNDRFKSIQAYLIKQMDWNLQASSSNDAILDNHCFSNKQCLKEKGSSAAKAIIHSFASSSPKLNYDVIISDIN